MSLPAAFLGPWRLLTCGAAQDMCVCTVQYLLPWPAFRPWYQVRGLPQEVQAWPTGVPTLLPVTQSILTPHGAPHTSQQPNQQLDTLSTLPTRSR